MQYNAEDVKIGLFPLSVSVDIKEKLQIAGGTVIDLKSIKIEIPFTSFFKKFNGLRLRVISPNVKLNKESLKGGDDESSIDFGKLFDFIYVENGKFSYKDGDFEIRSDNLNIKTGKSDDFSSFFVDLGSFFLKFSVDKKSSPVVLVGPLKSFIKKRNDTFFIKKFKWKTVDISVEGHGEHKLGKKTSEFSFNVRGRPYNFLKPILGTLSPQGFFYINGKLLSNASNEVDIKGKFNAREFVMNKMDFNNLNGNITYESKDQKINISANLISKGKKGNLSINVIPDKAVIKANNLPVEKVKGLIDISEHIPFDGVIDKGKVEMLNHRYEGEVLLKADREATEKRKGVNGKVSFSFNNFNGDLKVDAKAMKIDFGEADVLVNLNVNKGDTDILVDALVFDLSSINVYTKHYLDLDLSPWKFNGGNGRFNLKVKGKGEKVNYFCEFNFKDFFSNKCSVESIEGSFGDSSGQNKGSLVLKDPDLSLNADIFLNNDDTLAEMQVLGKISKVLDIFELDIPAQGNLDGSITYKIGKGDKLPEIKGIFQSELLTISDIPLKEVKSDFLSDTENFSFSNCNFNFYGGNSTLNFRINQIKSEYDLSFNAKKVSLNSLSDNFLIGQADLNLKGNGKMNKDPIAIEVKGDINQYEENVEFFGNGTINTDFKNFWIKSSTMFRYNKLESVLDFQLSYNNNEFRGEYSFPLKDINLLLPWNNNEGQALLKGEIHNAQDGSIEYQGIIELKGKTLSLPKFSHTLDNFSGLLIHKGFSSVSLQSFTGYMGGGEVEIRGDIQRDAEGFKKMDILFSGSDMRLHLMDRTTAVLDADLNLTLKDKNPVLGGDIFFDTLLWKREIDEDISFYTSSDIEVIDSKFMDDLQFDVNLRGSRNIWMDNFTAKVKGAFNLQLKGSMEYPIILGEIKVDSGDFYFSERKFPIIRAKLTFGNKLINDPELKAEAETYIKNYRIKFSVDGNLSRLRPELTSSPPLPVQDIFSLISMGELFERATSGQLSSGAGNISTQYGTTDLISSQLSGLLQKRAKSLIGLDLFRVDPIFNNSSSFEGTSRLTMGKSINKDLLLVYSVQLTGSQQEDLGKQLIYLQYQLSPSFSIIGMRNEEGRYSFDIRYRKRHN